MAFYWTIAILTVLINLYPIKNQNQYSVRLILSLIPLFLYGAFRVNYGLDYNGYEDFFNGVKVLDYNADERIEVGYFYLNMFLPTFRSLLIVQSILLCAAYYYLFKWYIPTKYAYFGFILLFLCGPLTIFFMLSGIRNGIAISILILSTYFIQKRNIIKFSILVFVAYLFHNSVILYAPIAYVVANGKPITKRSMIVWLSVMAFIAFASATIAIDYIEIFISNYLNRYSTYVEKAKEHGVGAGFLVTVFSFIISIILLLLLKNKKLLLKESMILKLTLLFFLSNLLGPLNMRMAQNFAPFFISGSVWVANQRSNKYFKYGYIITIFAYLIYALKIWLDNPNFSYETYQSVFF